MDAASGLDNGRVQLIASTREIKLANSPGFFFSAADLSFGGRRSRQVFIGCCWTDARRFNGQFASSLFGEYFAIYILGV